MGNLTFSQIGPRIEERQLQSDGSRPSVGVGATEKCYKQCQEPIRVARIIAGGAAGHQGAASKKSFFFLDGMTFFAIKLRYPLRQHTNWDSENIEWVG